MHRERYSRRAEHQRLRIIRLLEQLADRDEKEQCEKCGRWFDSVASHAPHCNK